MLARLSVAPVDNVVQRRDREPSESYGPEKTHNTTNGPEDHQAHPNRKDRESDSDLEDQFPECHALQRCKLQKQPGFSSALAPGGRAISVVVRRGLPGFEHG